MIKRNVKIELLAPAKDKKTAISAINAGADAVYIGYLKFGARKQAGNSLNDIKEIVEYANIYRVKIYVTLNTIYKNEEIDEVIKTIYELYNIGVSAIIIQDMGILEYKLPPIKIFASTQCHNNSLEKIKFLENSGIERVILPREFSLEEIEEISNNSNIEIETFIHGALCVSYSGQCYLSYANGGRSANRGECAQPCRKKYTLTSSDNKIICKDKYLLSLKDLNLSEKIEDLINAGVTSFKIEGRLKDDSYVKNIVAFYRKKIDKILNKLNLEKSSKGISYIDFEPNPYKSFNRDFTEFFINGKRENFCTIDYVKSIGEFIGTVKNINKNYFILQGKKLNNGDGICFLNSKNELVGTQIQKIENDKIYPQKIQDIKKNTKIYRNFDIDFNKTLQKEIKRKIDINAEIEISKDKISLNLFDDEGNFAKTIINETFDIAENKEKALDTIKTQILKTGTTEFHIKNIKVSSDEIFFVKISILNDLRRQTVEKLQKIRKENLKIEKQKKQIKIIDYPIKNLDYSFNIYNDKAKNFYKKRNSNIIEMAAESQKNLKNKTLMTSKHCIKYTLGLCKKYFKPEKEYKEPYILVDETYKKYILEFDCKKCEMHVKPNNNN